MNETIAHILEFDRKHIWHPYTSIENPLPVYPVHSAEGVEIKLMDGRVLIDGMSSWWSAIHGYNHPVLTKCIQEQAATLSHIMFGGFTHEPAVNLSKKLIEISPEGLERVFLCDSGSVAVEVAMKMAIQYFYSIGKPTKHRFATIRSGYHGDTFHAMSVCDPETGMHNIYSDLLPNYFFADQPKVAFDKKWDESDIEPLRKIFHTHQQSLCGLILEPIVQGAGGMKFYNPEYLKAAKQLCDEYDVLLIADEIATGLGRTGEMFGCNHAGITPDILCLGKTLTGGYMTLAAVLTTDKVGKGISNGNPGVFMHGPTFMGNPLACAVASKSIELLTESNWKGQIKVIESTLSRELQKCCDFPWVVDVRVLGGIGVVEVARTVDMEKIQQAFVDRGVWLRPFGKLIYLMPPYCIDEVDLTLITDAIFDILSDEKGW